MTRAEKAAAIREVANKAIAAELHLPDAFAEMRLALGLTQADFAARLGMTRRQIGDLENGRANPTLETVNKVCRIFGLVVGLIPRRPRQIGAPLEQRSKARAN